MQQQLREMLGQALQAKRRELVKCDKGQPVEHPWEERIELAKEIDRACAETVIEQYWQWLGGSKQ